MSALFSFSIFLRYTFSFLFSSPFTKEDDPEALVLLVLLVKVFPAPLLLLLLVNIGDLKILVEADSELANEANLC